MVGVAVLIARHGVNVPLFDEWGMSAERVGIITSLGREPMSKATLAGTINVKPKELEKYIIDPLVAVTPDRPIPLVCRCSRGYSITPTGLEALDVRGIEHNGQEAMPPSVRSKYE